MVQKELEKIVEIFKLKFVNLALFIAFIGVLLLYLSTLQDFSKYSVVFDKLGTVLIPSGLISALSNFVLRKTFLEEMLIQIKKASMEDDERLMQMESTGLQKIHKELPIQQVLDGFDKAKKISIFTTWIPNYETLGKKIFNGIKDKNKEVKILLLCPMSELAKYREIDLSSEVNVRTIINENIDRLKNCEVGNKNSGIKIYRHTTPTFISFQLDDTVLYSPFFKEQGVQSPCFEFRDNDNSFLVKEIRNHFDQIWKDEDAISIGKCIKFKELGCPEKCLDIN